MAVGPKADLSGTDNRLIGGTADEIATILCIQITALAGGGTVKVQGSMDNTTKVDLQMMPWGSSTGVASATAAGGFRVDVAGIPFVFLDNVTGTASVYWKFVNG